MGIGNRASNEIWVHYGLTNVAMQTGQVKFDSKEVFLRLYGKILSEDFVNRVKVRSHSFE